MGRGATAGMGTRGRGALSGLRANLEEAKRSLETARADARWQEYLVRYDAVTSQEMSERARILEDSAKDIQEMHRKRVGWRVIDAAYEKTLRQLNQISAIAERRLRQLKEQYESGAPMNPE